eukprot:2330750-Rhodomonas_salina.2
MSAMARKLQTDSMTWLGQNGFILGDGGDVWAVEESFQAADGLPALPAEHSNLDHLIINVGAQPV